MPPFWLFYMLACAALILMGRDGKWFTPAAILAGLLAMRLVMGYTEGAWQQVTACAVWLSVAALLSYKGLWLPSILCATSGIAYPALMLVGLRIEYLGLVAIVADVLLLAALVASYIGGGGGGVAHNTGDSPDRGVLLVVDGPEGLATHQNMGATDPRQN